MAVGSAVGGSVLRVFKIAFRVDADDVRTANKKIIDSAREAAAIEGKLQESIDETTDAIERQDDSAETFAGTILKVGAAVTALVAAVGAIDIINDTTNRLVDLGDAARNLDMPVGTLDAWGKALEKLGGEANSAATEFESLEKRMQEGRFNPKGNFAQDLLGVGINLFSDDGSIKRAEELMLELADVAESVDRRWMSTFLGGSLGLSPAAIDLILSGRKEMERILEEQKKISVATADAIEKAREYQDNIKAGHRQIQLLKDEIVIKLLPAIIELLELADRFTDTLVEWWHAGREFFDMFARDDAELAQWFADQGERGEVLKSIWEGLKEIVADLMDAFAAIAGIDFGDGEGLKEFGKGALDLLLWALNKAIELVGILTESFKLLAQQIGEDGPIFENISKWLSDPIGYAYDAAQLDKAKDVTKQSTVDILSDMYGDFAKPDFFSDEGRKALARQQRQRREELIERYGLHWLFGGSSTDQAGKLIPITPPSNDNTPHMMMFPGGSSSLQQYQEMMTQANMFQFNSQRGGQVGDTAFGGPGGRSVSVSVGAINIETAATDAEGIAAEIGNATQQVLRDVLVDYDDGEVA